ncbi:anti-sigma factor family protein [Tengunoibacter tsumagoiensis]|uniref:Putative zinc-finger domain-containing protein n=1 Tax=Tengunoibacter tsumagoiensis TaxID=2014871 RepID=A0A402A4N4_9CHLR|nr:zf-HC2 domain-containing protein [Tengunoibacter tsumagoiensis]GCE14103.1 hypothetical protein KTT_39620 [Tengunoibacter tsumagoiensis]
MRCSDVKARLGAQHEGNLEAAIASALQEHLASCDSCRVFEQQQRHIDILLCAPTPQGQRSQQPQVSTDTIMRAIQQRRRITQQLEELQQQQQIRVKKMRKMGAASAALSVFTLSCIPLLFLTLTMLQTDLAVKMLALLNGVIDTCMILAQYLQTGLSLVTRDNWIFSGFAFAVVVMMGMWLRLMRPPKEA